MARIAILSGDTFQFKDRIRDYRTRGERAWSWDAERKAWTRALSGDDADMTPDQVESRYVRGIPGIRNRGNFSVTIEGV